MIANYLAWLILGCFIGWLMSQILPPQQTGKLRADMAMGAASAFGTGIVTQLLVRYPAGEFSIPLLIVSILGSVVALATHRTFVRT